MQFWIYGLCVVKGGNNYFVKDYKVQPLTGDLFLMSHQRVSVLKSEALVTETNNWQPMKIMMDANRRTVDIKNSATIWQSKAKN
jgi:hypothetical protein